MILKALIDPVMGLIIGLIDTIPDNSMTLPDVSGAADIIGYSAYFFPMDTFGQIIALFLFWYTALMAWAIVEWVYKKIPGVS